MIPLPYFHALFVSCFSKSLPFFQDLNCYEKDPHPHTPLSHTPPQSFYGSAEAEGFIVVLRKMPLSLAGFSSACVATMSPHSLVTVRN